MNLVAGVMSFPVSAGLDVSLARSEDTIHQMEVYSQGDLAVVLQRNLLISQVFVWWIHSYSCSVFGRS